MTLFWILTAAMIVAALALLAPTLLKRLSDRGDDTETLNVAIARDRLNDLVKEKQAGELSDEEFAQARADLELALAQDLGSIAGTAGSSSAGGRGALVFAVLLIPLMTIPLYFHIGSPQLITNPPGSQAATNHSTQNLPPITELAEQLRQRMEENPDNAEGWFLLGRTYMRMQNYAQAAQAYEQVVRLVPDEPAGLLSLADATIMRDGMRTGPEALALLEKALSIDPDNVTALWLLGNAAFDNGAVAGALSYWQRAYPLLANEPQMQAQLGERISNAGGELPALAPTAADLPAIMPTADTPTAPAAAPAAAPSSPEAAEGGIRVQVALAPALLEQAAPTDTVFVLARAESGPPMPLAVARHQVADLPLDVTLTDAMAMMPAMKLSAFPRVKVTAKVSKSGGAATQTGDLLAASQVVDSASPPDSVQLLIDQVAE
jgi:cytochrome c-type biogenesis protein CcmH